MGDIVYGIGDMWVVDGVGDFCFFYLYGVVVGVEFELDWEV